MLIDRKSHPGHSDYRDMSRRDLSISRWPHGRIACIRGVQAASILSSPVSIDRQGAEWHRLRQAVAPKMLRLRDLHANVPAFNDVANDAMGRLASVMGTHGHEGEVPDLDGEVFKWSTECTLVLVCCLLSSSLLYSRLLFSLLLSSPFLFPSLLSYSVRFCSLLFSVFSPLPFSSVLSFLGLLVSVLFSPLLSSSLLLSPLLFPSLLFYSVRFCSLLFSSLTPLRFPFFLFVFQIVSVLSSPIFFSFINVRCFSPLRFSSVILFVSVLFCVVSFLCFFFIIHGNLCLMVWFCWCSSNWNLHFRRSSGPVSRSPTGRCFGNYSSDHRLFRLHAKSRIRVREASPQIQNWFTIQEETSWNNGHHDKRGYEICTGADGAPGCKGKFSQRSAR